MQNNQQDQNEQQIQKKHQKLLYKISYQDDPQSNQAPKYKYSSETLIPFVYFFKLLALRPCERQHKNQLILNIPDTIVFNDGDNPVMWFYTNQRGEVCRIDNVPYFQITTKFCQNAFDKELVAVLKKPTYGYGGPCGNQVKVVSASEIKTVLSLILGSRNEISVLQRFVKSGSVKPSIVRTCWRASGNNESWTLNSNYEYTSKSKVPQISKFIVNTKISKGFRVIKNVSQKYTNQTLKYVKNIVDFVSRNLKIKFTQFVCDFVKDEAGNWWFINVKAFQLSNSQKINIKPITMHDDDTPQQQRPKKNLETYTKCKNCKYCNKIIAQHLMTHKLTLMMILQCDQHLIRLGKSFPWLDRCFNYHVSSVNLYVEHKVCDSCFQLYMQVQDIVQLEHHMAVICGVGVKADNRNVVSITAIPAFKGESPQFGSRFSKVKYDTDMPQNWGLPVQQKIYATRQNQKQKPISRCKFMIFIHGLRDIPPQFQQNSHNYCLSYTFMNQSVKYNINLDKSQELEGMLKIKIDKIKVIYFFVQSRDDIVDFLKKQNKLKVELLEDGEVMGQLELELDDFKSDKVIKKDFFKMFSGPKVLPYLSWGLFVSLGLHEGQKIQSKTLKLTRKNHILLPQQGYHCPGLLPEQWIQMINQKPDITASSGSIQSELGEQQQQTLNGFSQFNMKQKQMMESQLDQYAKQKTINSQKAKRKVYY